MKVLLFEHAEHEGAGLLGDALTIRRATIDRRRLHRGDALPESLDGYDLVIAMGGPQDAWDDVAHRYLAGEAKLLAESARAGRPTLGICLGAQLLARGLGARVYRGPRSELGVAPITLTDEGRADERLRALDGRDVLHWHSDTFDLPEGAVLLASTELYPHQAFRLGARCYAVQFHVECDTAMRRVWARVGEQELRKKGVQPASLIAPGTGAMDERGRTFAAAFLLLCGGM